jgi:intracellular septation protein
LRRERVGIVGKRHRLGPEPEVAMKNLFDAGKLLLLDLASTIFFLAVYLLTHNVPLSVALGIALGATQISWQLLRKKPIETMEWLSLFLVVASGVATLLTNNPRFVMFKPSLIYIVVGVVMLNPGWINRYLPPIAKAVVPDIAIVLGFLWAGLMFVSAALNAFVAVKFSLLTWATFMPIYGIVSKIVLFLIGFAALRYCARRRLQKMPVSERNALTASAG